MNFASIYSVTPLRRIDGKAAVVVEMSFTNDRERDALLTRAGLPVGSSVVPRMTFILRTDDGIQPRALSLDGRGAHAHIVYNRVSRELLAEVRKALEARRRPTGYGRGAPANVPVERRVATEE